MKKMIPAIVLLMVLAFPALAGVQYFATQSNPEVEVLYVDDLNRLVVLDVPGKQREYLSFPASSGQTFNVTYLTPPFKYVYFRYDYSATDWREGFILWPPHPSWPAFPAVRLQYPGEPLIVSTNLVRTRSGQSPVPPVSVTREQLQLTDGTFTIPPIGTFTVPEWASMAPGATIDIAGDATTVDLGGLSPLSHGFSVTAPGIITQLSVDFAADPGDKTIVALVRQEGAALDDTPFPWAVVEAVGRVLITGGQNLVSGLRKFVILPLQGYDCDYSHPAQLSGGTIVTTVYKSESCEAEPWWIPDVVAGADEARLWAASEQFQLDPVQKFIVLTGGTAPIQASSIDGVVYLNRPFFESIPSVLKRKGVIYHEMAHSMMDYLLPDSLFSRNRHIEATATAAEQRIKPENTSWIDRYPTWSATDVERGLNGIFNPNADGMYNSFFVLDMYRRFPERNILKDFYALGAPDFITGNGIAAWMASLQVTYTELQTLFGEAVSICHQNISPMQNVFGLCGDGTLAIDPFNGPTQIQVGETVIWQHPGGDATVHIEGNPNAPTDSLVTMMAAGDPNGWSVSFDGFLTGDYPLANLPADDYTITATSLEGVNYGTLDEYVTVEIERNSTCAGGGPWLFDGGETGTAYDGACNDMGYNVRISETSSSHICPDTPGIDEVGVFEVTLEIVADLRDGSGLPWPIRIVGNRTNAAVPDQYMPTEMFEFGNPGGCDRLGARAETWWDRWRESTHINVHWHWNCAEGGCDGSNSRPPAW